MIRTIKKCAISGLFCAAFALLLLAGGIDEINAACLACVGGSLLCLAAVACLGRKWGAELSKDLEED